MERDRELLVMVFRVSCLVYTGFVLSFRVCFFFLVKFMSVLNIYMIQKSELQKDSRANPKEPLPMAIAGIVWATK